MLIALLVTLAVVLGLRVYYLLESWRTLRALSALLTATDGNGLSPAPSLSVLIPARNEEHNIGQCLDSVVQNDYPILEIIVIDDGSTDRTSDIVEAMQQRHGAIRLVKITELPPGWIGKNYALHRGVQHARGEYLLFLDADVRLAPECITRTMRCARQHGSDLLTLFPRVTCVGFWERVVLPYTDQVLLLYLSQLKGLRRHASKPNPNAAVAHGAYLLFKRYTYDAIGGHARVKGWFGEDTALARVVIKDGYTFTCLLGWPDLLTARLYSTLKQIWEGTSRWQANSKKRQQIVRACFGVSLFVLPWLSIPIALGAQWLYGPDWLNVSLLILAVCVSVLALFNRWSLAQSAGIDNTYAYLEALGALVCVAVLVNSVIRTTPQKGVHWKGRTYPTYEKVGRDKRGP